MTFLKWKLDDFITLITLISYCIWNETSPKPSKIPFLSISPASGHIRFWQFLLHSTCMKLQKQSIPPQPQNVYFCSFLLRDFYIAKSSPFRLKFVFLFLTHHSISGVCLHSPDPILFLLCESKRRESYLDADLRPMLRARNSVQVTM